MTNLVITSPKPPIGIKVYNSVLHPDLCSRVIEYFESRPEARDEAGLVNGQRRTFSERMFEEGELEQEPIMRSTMRRVRHCLDLYFDEHIACEDLRNKIKKGCYSLQPRMKRYDVGDKFPLHADDSTLMSIPRRFAYILYLNDDFEGGNTVFRSSKEEIARVVPQQGAMLVFPVHPIYMHEGEQVTQGSKYILNGFATVITSQIRFVSNHELPKQDMVMIEISSLATELMDAAKKVFPKNP